MNALVTHQTPIAIGTAIAGGFFAGVIQDRAIIVAPKAEGEITLEWGNYGSEIEGAGSYFDGAANTVAMATANSPLAIWAKGLRIGAHDDWYIPSRDELEVIYRALKPTDEENTRYSGDNPTTGNYAYQDAVPAQTAVEAFQSDNAEAFESRWYWSSTQFSAYGSWDQLFGNGGQYGDDKSSARPARAVRSIPLSNLAI